MPGANAVFSLPELLEAILGNLDLRTLLLSQRVSCQFRDIIASSPRLQRQLFFVAEHAESIEHMTTQRRRNPLLEQVFTAWFENKDHHGGRGDDNPFERLYGKVSQKKGESVASERRRQAFLHREASWRRMLVQQPACERLGFIRQYGDSEQVYQGAVLRFPLPSSRWAARRRLWGDRNEWEEDGDDPDIDGASDWAMESAEDEGADADAAVPGPLEDPCSDRGGVRMGALYDLLLSFKGTRQHASSGYRVLWRQPCQEPSAYSSGWAQCSDHSIILQRDLGPEVGIVVFQRGRDRLVQSMKDPRVKQEWVCQGSEEESQEVTMKYSYAQDWFG